MFLQYLTLKLIMPLPYVIFLLLCNMLSPCYYVTPCILLTKYVYMDTFILSYFVTHTNTFPELHTHTSPKHRVTQSHGIINRLYILKYTKSCIKRIIQLRSIYKTTSIELNLIQLPSIYKIYVNLVLDNYSTGSLVNG